MLPIYRTVCCLVMWTTTLAGPTISVCAATFSDHVNVRQISSDLGVPFLTILPNTGTAVDSNRASYNFGEIDALDGKVTHTFLVKNASETSIVIDHVVTSCGCTSASIGTAEPDTHSAIVEPGVTVAIIVAFDASDMYPGETTKVASLYTPGLTVPIATFVLKGVITPAIVILPSTVDFGRSLAGQTIYSSIIVEEDSRLCCPGSDVILTSQSGEVEVKRTNRKLDVHGGKVLVKDEYELIFKPITTSDHLDSTLTLKLVRKGVSCPLPPGTQPIGVISE